MGDLSQIENQTKELSAISTTLKPFTHQVILELFFIL